MPTDRAHSARLQAAHRFLQEEPVCSWTLEDACTLLMVTYLLVSWTFQPSWRSLRAAW